MAKVVMLNSGGLDTACVAKKLYSEGYEIYSLYLSLGQPNDEKAQIAAAEIAAKWCVNHKVLTIDFGMPYAVEYQGVVYAGIHASSMMAFIAASYARLMEIHEVYTGIQGVVDLQYEDRINSLLEVVRINNWRPSVIAPLQNVGGYESALTWCSSDIKEMEFTVSCNEKEPCGTCSKCKLRESLTQRAVLGEEVIT